MFFIHLGLDWNNFRTWQRQDHFSDMDNCKIAKKSGWVFIFSMTVDGYLLARKTTEVLDVINVTNMDSPGFQLNTILLLLIHSTLPFSDLQTAMSHYLVGATVLVLLQPLELEF